jgi:hypothetical protein
MKLERYLVPSPDSFALRVPGALYERVIDTKMAAEFILKEHVGQ